MEPQTVANFLTAILGATTVWLGIETRRMAIAAKASVDLESTPFLAFRGIDLKFSSVLDTSTDSVSPALRVALRLGNPGKVRVTYEVESLEYSINGSIFTKAAVHTTGGVIFPGEETLFLLPFVPITAPPEVTSAQVAPTGEVIFSIIFWGQPNQRQTVWAKVQFNVTSANPIDWQWVFVNGPTYA